MAISVRRTVVAAVTVGGLVAAAGCGAGSAGGSAGAGVLVGQIEPVHVGSLTSAQVAADNTEFGFALFRKLCDAQPDGNLVLSPASAAEALGMLDAGSVGKTRAAVSRLLDLPGWSSSLIAALHGQSDALSQVPQVTVSNHVFEQTGLAPTSQTLNALRTAYDADLRQLDFAQEPAATNAINAVVSHDTDGLIPKLFDDPLDATTQTVLADAILLDAKWRDPFPTARSGVFHTAAGESVTVSMMQNPDGAFGGRLASGWSSVVLPYVGNLQAVALLPPARPKHGVASGPPAVPGCATPSAATLQSLTTGPSQTVGVVLPKLDLSQTLPLTHDLASMGLPLMGHYSGLGAGDNQISQVVQKVVMKVDQKGTKAAAATGIPVASLALRVNRTVTFDRPFLLLLEDTATHTPLFLARVANPTAG